VLAADGSFNYTPTDGYAGMDAFLYRISDGTQWSPLAAVTIHVMPTDGPDEAPLPDAEPEPQPEPCRPRPPRCPDSDLLANAEGNGHHHGHFAHAVDAIFSRRWGWHS
jgi:hypothetical protein